MARTKGNMTLRIEPELKEQASNLFKAMGLDLSTATGIFYRQALRCHGLPFEVKIDEPNVTTYAAMEEAEQMLKDPSAKKFHSIDELFEELDS
jgi:DNA-damage-inducible protein J